MGPLGSVFRDLLFFQGYVADPALVRALEDAAGEPPHAAAAEAPAAAPGDAAGAPLLRPALR